MITIRPPAGVRLTELGQHLVQLAGGDRSAVKSGNGGLVVDEDLARAYLTERLNGTTPPPQPPAPQPAPPVVVQAVEQVERAGGLHNELKPDAATPTSRRQRPTRKETRRV